MKTRIATSSGLALTLIVGIFATLLALGVLDAKSVWAGAIGQTNLTVTADPNDPGAIAKWTITFDNPLTIAANTGEIISILASINSFMPILPCLSICVSLIIWSITLSIRSGSASNWLNVR